MENTKLHGFEAKTVENLEELEEMLKDASKGIAKVDKTYVDYEGKGHLFQYDINFKEFLENINYILSKN
jgi:hypothetical protein